MKKKPEGMAPHQEAGRLAQGRDDTSFNEQSVFTGSKRDEPFNDDNWLFEVKYDGYRMTIVKRAETCGSGTGAASTQRRCSRNRCGSSL
ncbi:hypothetical protein AAFF_G00069800 [Aldrovandia affinis]|uniref:Uncharacterized protein n=1 Tax=Aldrovandia affinis TaxID=143900 RepID=A0AAD7R1U8_9TELE|nr:hypothetical protein AAFF_G00069800 [Aldrovandia affinis]